MRRLLPLLVVIALAGCTTDADSPAAPSPAPSPVATTTRQPEPTPTSAPSPAPPPSPTPGPAFSDWVVGARVLPERPDGFGEVRPTPRQLRERLLPTVDVLPPPADGTFHSSIGQVTAAFVRRTDLAWKPACPVGLADLRYLRMSFWGFDGAPHTGEMVVAATVAEDVVGVFQKLYTAKFPLEQMTLVTQADLGAPPTGDGNSTAGYACRPTTGATGWSAHAYGIAVDLNPFNNPYTKGDLVLPELSSSYLDRDWKRPGMIYPGDVVTRAFADIGWTWGGTWHSLKDRHHFSANGR